MRKTWSKIGGIILMVAGMSALAFFRFTKFFGRSMVSGAELTLSVTDLREESVCKLPAQETEFFNIQSSINREGATSEVLTQAKQAITGLISQAEGAGPERSAVLRTTRMQICNDLGIQPYQEDVTFVGQTIQQPGYPPPVRSKIVRILDTMGINVERTED